VKGPLIVRACLTCGWPTPAGERCPNPACSRSRRRPSQSSQPERSHAERQRRKAAVDEWVQANGWQCPGVPELGRPPHPAHDLTFDHGWPTSLGGPIDGPGTVRCRGCNTARGGRNRIRFPSKGAG
jgi:hypothetical protein